MIGIVVVSHSPALANAAVDLALQMVVGARPAIAVAAGAGEGHGDLVIGTDAIAVAAAIDQVAGPDGVLVIMDLGSAVMSAEMALDFVTTDAIVRLSAAPFVEGLLAAIVTASSGADLDAVDREACSALSPKISMLRPTEPVASPPGAGAPVADEYSAGAAAAEHAADVTVLNPDGLHARPAANLVSTVAGYDAKLTFANHRTAGKPVSANSLIGLLSLGAKQGDVLTVVATGPQASAALQNIVAQFADGFGELPA